MPDRQGAAVLLLALAHVTQRQLDGYDQKQNGVEIGFHEITSSGFIDSLNELSP